MPNRRKPVDEKLIVHLYTQEHMPGNLIAKRMGITIPKVYRVLKWNNVTVNRIPTDGLHIDPLVRRRAKEKSLKDKYGLTPEDYERILVSQNGRCAICNIEAEKSFRSQLNVDHDHKTGVVRGMLCLSCNNMLGLARDNKDILRAAIRYLSLDS